jgi:hypothetical protein
VAILGAGYCCLLSYGYCVCEQLLTTTGFFCPVTLAKVLVAG